MSIDPGTAAGRITAGVDWAKDDHAVCVAGGQGEVLERFTVRYDAAGLRQMAARLLRAGVAQAGIERGDGPVADTLLQAGLAVFVIPPGQVKSLRSRYGSAGNKDDRFDACVLADVVRTDARRLRPMERDSEQAAALRSTVRARRDLAGHRVAAASQLRAHLEIAFPGAAALFAEVDSEITLAFLSRFTTQEQADWLSPLRLVAWLKSAAYSGKADPAVLHARLLAAPRGQAGPHACVHAAVTVALVAVLRALNTQAQALAASISAQLAAHPDDVIFTSLPRSGAVRAARLLAETGDARGRFPTRDSLTCLAGVAPSTRQSGKVKAVTFRWGAGKQLRDALCDFAGDSRSASPWAASLYDKAIACGCDHPHAVRILARAWAHVIWRCWQDHAPLRPSRPQQPPGNPQTTPASHCLTVKGLTQGNSCHPALASPSAMAASAPARSPELSTERASSSASSGWPAAASAPAMSGSASVSRYGSGSSAAIRSASRATVTARSRSPARASPAATAASASTCDCGSAIERAVASAWS
jgi:transposase